MSQLDNQQLTVCHVSPMENLGGVECMLIDLLTQKSVKNIRHVLMPTAKQDHIIAPVLQANVPTFIPERRSHYDPKFVFDMAHWLNEQGVHLVHSYGAVANTWGNMAALIAKIPIFVTGEHGSSWWIRPPTAWFDRWACQRSKQVVANSYASKSMLEYRYKITTEKIKVIYNGVSPLPAVDKTRLRKELGLGSELIIGSVGRVDTPKDFITFVSAAAQILKKRNDVYFLLVGGGPLEDDIRENILGLGISDHFIFTGWRSDARELVQIFDIFVSTSIRESFGNVLVEASLAGKPVIAPNIDGVSEVVVNQETGILLNPTEAPQIPETNLGTPLAKKGVIAGKITEPRALNIDELVAAMEELIESSYLRQKYGHAARQRAEKMFSILRYQQDLEETYVALAEKYGVFYDA